MLSTLAEISPIEAKMIPTVTAMTIGFLIAIVAIVGGTVRSILTTRAREQTKREVAAYVAEGSMRPEEAERLLNAGGRGSGKS
jgi:hypothetical protein